MRVAEEQAKMIREVKEQISRQQLSEETVASPNFKVNKMWNVEERKLKSFHSPHRIAKVNSKMKAQLLMKVQE